MNFLLVVESRRFAPAVPNRADREVFNHIASSTIRETFRDFSFCASRESIQLLPFGKWNYFFHCCCSRHWKSSNEAERRIRRNKKFYRYVCRGINERRKLYDLPAFKLMYRRIWRSYVWSFSLIFLLSLTKSELKNLTKQIGREETRMFKVVDAHCVILYWIVKLLWLSLVLMNYICCGMDKLFGFGNESKN